MNKYQKWYNNLCKRGQERVTKEYTEKHHIIPESFFKTRKRKGPAGWLLGDSDATENITRLTDREHELVHYLLTKIHKDSKRAYFKVLKAYEMRSLVNPNQENKRHFSSRRLAGVRAERARLQSEAMCGEGNPNYGKTWTDEQKEEHSRKITGRKQTPEALDNLRTALTERKRLGLKRKAYSEEYKEERSKMYSGNGNPNFGKKTSAETKKKIGDKIRGRKQTQEEKDARGLANIGKKREKKLCPHCVQHIAVNTYPRFHGPNCKQARI
jgi:hypothetical protein